MSERSRYASQVTKAYNGCRRWDDGVVRGYPVTNDPLSHWVDEYYGGKKATSTASNIVFSNGQLDPWSSGGVLTNKSLPSTYPLRTSPLCTILCTTQTE